MPLLQKKTRIECGFLLLIRLSQQLPAHLFVEVLVFRVVLLTAAVIVSSGNQKIRFTV